MVQIIYLLEHRVSFYLDNVSFFASGSALLPVQPG